MKNWLVVMQHIQFLLFYIPASDWKEPSCTWTIFSWPHTQSRLLCYILVLRLQLSSRDAILKKKKERKNKPRLMKSLTVFAPGIWKRLLTVSLSSCSKNVLMKIVWQICLLRESWHPLSNRHHFSSVDTSVINNSSGTLPIRNLEPYSKVRDAGTNGRTWLI